MIVRMIRNMIAATALIVAGLLIGCGVSTTGPDGGSRHQTQNGVNENGYPGTAPADAGSPALASSSESKYSRDQEEEKK